MSRFCRVATKQCFVYNPVIMSKHLTPVDISTITTYPDLLHLVEEVNTTKQPRILKRDSETVAVLMPVATAIQPKKRTKTKADHEAFLASAGSWKDVDTETLLKNI